MIRPAPSASAPVANDDDVAGGYEPQAGAGRLFDEIGIGGITDERGDVALETTTHSLLGGDLALDGVEPLDQPTFGQEAVRAEYGVVREMGRGEQQSKQHDRSCSRPSRPPFLCHLTLHLGDREGTLGT